MDENLRADNAALVEALLDVERAARMVANGDVGGHKVLELRLRALDSLRSAIDARQKLEGRWTGATV